MTKRKGRFGERKRGSEWRNGGEKEGQRVESWRAKCGSESRVSEEKGKVKGWSDGEERAGQKMEW